MGAKFRSLTESIDTSGPAGRMMMQMLGSFAEFEREMIRERTRVGLREAREKGRVPGRKPRITAEQKKEIVEAVASGGHERGCSKSYAKPISLLNQRIAEASINRSFYGQAASRVEISRKSVQKPRPKIDWRPKIIDAVAGRSLA